MKMIDKHPDSNFRLMTVIENLEEREEQSFLIHTSILLIVD